MWVADQAAEMATAFKRDFFDGYLGQTANSTLLDGFIITLDL
jgi:hypothetical protein